MSTIGMSTTAVLKGCESTVSPKRFCAFKLYQKRCSKYCFVTPKTGPQAITIASMDGGNALLSSPGIQRPRAATKF